MGTNTRGHQTKTRNTMSLADLRIYKVNCCYFDGGNLKAIEDMEEYLKIIIIGH